MKSTVNWSLYVVLDIGILDAVNLLQIAEKILAGGATVLQLRAKQLPVREIVALAAQLLPLAERAAVPLIINDHVDIALALGAHGVHLGVDDLPVALARQIMPDGLIGYSPEGTADARRAVADGADYLGVGPFAGTQTKADAGSPIGAAGVHMIRSAVSEPVLAVGGIRIENAAQAMEASGSGIVVASAATRVPDPEAAVRLLRRAIGR
ncbi:MAG: thiamine phosphate synthase [Herpetosiphon sp.]